MTKLTIENFKAMLDHALEQIKAREDEFSKLDAVIGDGDHGTAIVTALSAFHEQNTKYTLRPRLTYRIYTNIHTFGIILHISVSKELQKLHTYCQCRVVCGIVYVFFPPRTGVRGWKWVSISYMEGNHQ